MLEREKVLIVRPGALGDLVLALPAIELIRSRHSAAHITLAGTRAFMEIALPFVDRLLDFDSREMLGILSGGNAGCSHAYVFSVRRDEFIGRLETQGIQVTHIPSFQPEGSNEFQAEFLLRGLGGRQAVPRVRFLPGELEDSLAQSARGSLVIHAGAGSKTKRWPLANFIEAASALAARGQDVCWILGPADDLDLAGAPGRVLRPKNIRAAAAALANAGRFLGNDSGIAHLAHAAGARTLTLFGPTDPRIWASGPYIYTPGSVPSASVQDVLDRLPL